MAKEELIAEQQEKIIAAVLIEHAGATPVEILRVGCSTRIESAQADREVKAIEFNQKQQELVVTFSDDTYERITHAKLRILCKKE